MGKILFGLIILSVLSGVAYSYWGYEFIKTIMFIFMSPLALFGITSLIYGLIIYPFNLIKKKFKK
jgi:hypothetical protein